MKKLIPIAIIVFTILITIESCDEKSDDNNPNTIVFSGITTTDNTGFPTGFYDSTDWQYNDKWVNEEKLLFPDFASYNYDCFVDSLIEIIAYPNPFNDVVLFQIMKDSTTRIDYRIVNKNFEIVISQDSVYNNQIALNFESILSEPDELYRMYYRFITNNNCSYIGHGDIQVK